MAWSTIFANLASGNQPLSLLDAMFSQVAQMVAIPCTASGVNALSLSPATNAPTIAAYQDFSAFRFQAPSTTTGAVSAGFSGLATLPVYLSDGATQAGTGAMTANLEYVLVFVQSLNSGTGGFILEAAAVPAIPAVAGSAFTNLYIVNNTGTPNSEVNVSYDELVMNNTSGGAVRATNQSFTINCGTTGANGLDAGALAASTWYYVFGISNGTTAAGLMSTSSTAPTMPSGYTFKKRLGAWLTNSSSQLYQISQRGNLAQIVLGTNPANSTVNSSGAIGTYSLTSPVLATISLANVPPTAKAALVAASCSWKSGSQSAVMIAPNANWGGSNNGPEGSNGNVFPDSYNQAGASFSAWMLLETAQQIVGTGSNSGFALSVIAWEDNLG